MPTSLNEDQNSRDLEARVALVEHRFAINELTARYNEAWDEGDVEGWLDTFADDGEFIQKGVPQTKGIDALRVMITTMIPVGLVHLTMDSRISIEDGNARQQTRVILGQKSKSRAPGSSRWVTSGSYDDRLRLTPDGWKFVSRGFRPDASLGDLPAWW